MVMQNKVQFLCMLFSREKAVLVYSVLINGSD